MNESNNLKTNLRNKMRKLAILIILLAGFASAFAQEKYTVYAELLGHQKGLFSRKVKVTVDFGQNVSFWRPGDMKIVDSNGKDMVFNSMVDAMNFMGKCGWKFVQAYVVTTSGQNVHHWLMEKQVSSEDEIKAGFSVRADSPEAEITLVYLKRSSKSNNWSEVKTEVRESITQEEIQAIIDEWKSKSNDATIYDVKVSRKKL